MINKPTDDDMAFVSSNKALEYMKVNSKGLADEKDSGLRKKYANIKN